MTDQTDPLLLLRETINPYRHALHISIQRLRWDLHTSAWASRSRLKRFKNRYKGSRTVIVCNGPSLLQVDFASLAGTYCFGLNKINLLFDKTTWRPDSIVAVNPFVVEQNRDYFNTTNIPLFIEQKSKRHVSFRDNVVFLHETDQHKFARDCSVSIALGFTVTYTALQIAFHLGFHHVALIGCDHNFAQKGPPNAIATATTADPSHFDPRYFSNGMKWHLPDLEQSEHFYSLANRVFDAAGRTITNCTSGGKLEVFNRQPLREWLASAHG